MVKVDDSNPDVNSPLAQSLLTFASLPTSPSSPGFFDKVPSERQPRTLKGMPDQAEYFVLNDTEPLVMTLLAEIDHRGNYNRLAPYFSLPLSVLPSYTFIYLSLTFHSADRSQRSPKNSRTIRTTTVK